MNFSKKTLIAANCLLLLVHSSQADTIILKSGEKIVGNILREDADGYVVEIKKGTIRDEMSVPRADVSYVEKETADEKAFREMEGLVPTPELLKEEEYVARIEKIEGFLKTYPESKLVESARKMLDTLSEEYLVIQAGGIKFGEGMVSPDEYEANAYEYDVRIAEQQIKDSVARRDLLGALRMFSDYGVKFGESEGSQGMAALMLQVLKAYKQSLDENLASVDQRIEKREAGLVSMAPDDRAKTERALLEQKEKIQRLYQLEKAAGQKWITPDSFHKEGMQEALRQVLAETARLESLPAAQPLEMPLAEAYRVAWEKLSDGTDEEKKLVLDEAKARRLTEFYLEKLRARAGFGEN